MTKRIQNDHKRFRDVISGRKRKELKRLIKNGGIVRTRPKGGKVTISIPEIQIPRFVHGTSGGGLGRGPGKVGDTVGKDPKKGGKGGKKAGDTHGEGIQIQLELEEVLKFMSDELQLPRMKPKENQTFEEIKIKYNNISKNGPESLRHTRRTMVECIKRNAAMGNLNNKIIVPGSDVPINVYEMINSDRRYRQYNEVKIPSSNAVIMFARDCSYSMDEEKCEIVSDMSWWLDCWIKKYYEKVTRCYFVHDTLAEEVSEEKFYNYRYGGGTMCSSAFRLMADQLTSRFPPHKHNIYLFYFTDGENWGGDNEKIMEVIESDLNPNDINLIGITQVNSWSYNGSVKEYIDNEIVNRNLEHVNTASIGPKTQDNEEASFGYYNPRSPLTEDERNQQIIDAIRQVLTTKENS